MAAQFETTTEFSNLLRANTPVSRMMTTYTRRGPGQAYLKQVLASEIDIVISDNQQNLEINPLKVYEELIQDLEDKDKPTDNLPRGVTSEQASANPLVVKTTEGRLKEIERITSNFLDTIIENINQVPYGIRWICKQIRSLTKRDILKPQMHRCAHSSAVSSWRFINPANRNAPGLHADKVRFAIKRKPSAYPKRWWPSQYRQPTANKPTYSKEAYMASLAPFVKANQAREPIL